MSAASFHPAQLQDSAAADSLQAQALLGYL